MKGDDGSNRYSATNEIKNPDGSADVGIIASPNSDVNGSNAAQGQGGGRGKKPQNEGHKISKNTITATKGESDVGISSFNNSVVDCSNGGQGQGSREFEGICHDIDGNVITADNGSTNVRFENFGHINYNNCKTTSTKDHGKAAGGSSSAQGQGGGLNICDNNIEGDRFPKAYHNFNDIQRNLKTTYTENGGSTNRSRISKNKITARNRSSNVGKLNFHNVNVDSSNAGQGQGGSEGNEGFHENKGIYHNIDCNEITADNKSTNVGLKNFGNSNINFKSTSTKNHGKAAGGSSSAQGQGGSTNESIISDNKITAQHRSSDVGMFNFHNVNINAGQAEGGCEGNEGFLKHKGISHNISNNTIEAFHHSRNVGIQNFGSITYNCKSIISQLLDFLSLSY